MNDKEIINALIGKINLCKELDSWGTELCLEQLSKILDLINRKQAEIERLVDALCKKEDMTQLIAKERQQYYDELQAAKAEIKRLEKEVGKEFICFVGDPHKVEHCPYLEQLETAKAEAIKEFADLSIKRICKNVTPIPQQKYLITMCIQEIKNAKRELVGE